MGGRPLVLGPLPSLSERLGAVAGPPGLGPAGEPSAGGARLVWKRAGSKQADQGGQGPDGYRMQHSHAARNKQAARLSRQPVPAGSGGGPGSRQPTLQCATAQLLAPPAAQMVPAGQPGPPWLPAWRQQWQRGARSGLETAGPGRRLRHAKCSPAPLHFKSCRAGAMRVGGGGTKSAMLLEGAVAIVGEHAAISSAAEAFAYALQAMRERMAYC